MIKKQHLLLIALIIMIAIPSAASAWDYGNATIPGMHYNGTWVVAGGEVLCIGDLMANDLPIVHDPAEMQGTATLILVSNTTQN